MLYDVYCDESCHLEHDGQRAMVLGAVWCPHDKASGAFERMRDIKRRHGINPAVEIKWTKVSGARLSFYRDIVDYFFDNDDLHFRGVIIPDKGALRHERFGQSHDEWYYKMYFLVLRAILSLEDGYRIYLDVKDTRGAAKVDHLQQVLRRSERDFDGSVVQRIQLVRSHEIQLLQLADLIIGAVSYVNRDLSGSQAKLAVIEQIKARSRCSLSRSTLLREDKFNLLRWNADVAE